MKYNDPAAALNGVIGGIGEVGGDVMTLAGLQARLAAEDLREGADRVRPGVIALVAAVPLALASFTVLLFGTAYALSAAYGWAIGYTLLGVGAAGLIVAGAAAAFALVKFRDGAGALRRSREELERNVQWLRTVALHGAG